ncbi:poly A polymerase C-terminal region-like protein, partial [Tuber magnatum]
MEPERVSKVKSNPTKSKHLETAGINILELKIDFVNPRSELYSGDGRIPHIVCFTAPLTLSREGIDLMALGIRNPIARCPPPQLYYDINTLFYDLHTEQVEDFTGLGLQDPADRLIRTPLPPQETFADDPLRVLRLIRFASRLRFTIAPEAKAAMKLPEIKFALKAKISRERVGARIGEMSRAYNPQASLSLIYEVDLYKEVFAPQIRDLPVLPVQDMKIAETSCATSLRTPAAAIAIKEALRCSNVESKIIGKVFVNWNVIQNMVINFDHWSRCRIGVDMRTLGAGWKNQVGACLSFELIDLRKNARSDEVEARGVMDKYETFLKAIAEEGSEGAFRFKSLMKGNVIAAECTLIPGAWMKPLIEKSLKHQLENPQKGKDELLQWVRRNRQALLDGLEYVGVGMGKGK